VLGRRASAVDEIVISPGALYELTEAAARGDQAERARAAVGQLSQLAAASASNWARGMAARSRALVSSGRAAEEEYLVEHQSSDDPLMAFRVLRYVTRIWDQYEREHPKARRLPAVIPLVVYQGPGRWASPVQLLDVIDLGPGGRQAVQAWLPRFEFLLDDLTRAREDQLLARELTPAALVTLLLLKTARGNPQITADLRRWTGHLRAVLDQPGGSEAFIVLLTYIELVSDAPVGELRDLAASLGPDAEEAYVTTAEMLRAEGEARGKARGKAEDILVVFEQRGIDVDERSRELIESCTDLDTLNGWLRRAFKVDKASDLFEE
jgi:hypothetical protein